MTPTELQYVQAKIGNSFLRAFYPADYRAMNQSTSALIKIENEEYRRLKTTESLTSKINIKMARTIGLLQKEINMLLEALDSVQNAVYIGGDEILESEAMDEAMQRATGGFDIFNQWRKIRRFRQILRELEQQRKRQKEKADKKKTDEDRKAEKDKKEADRARQTEEDRIREQNSPRENRPSLPGPETKPTEPKVEGPGSGIGNWLKNQLGFARMSKFVLWMSEIGISFYMVWELILALPDFIEEVQMLSSLGLPEDEFRMRVTESAARILGRLTIFAAAASIAGIIVRKVIFQLLFKFAAGGAVGAAGAAAAGSRARAVMMTLVGAILISIFVIMVEQKAGEMAADMAAPTIDDIVDMIVRHYYPNGYSVNIPGEEQSSTTSPVLPSTSSLAPVSAAASPTQSASSTSTPKEIQTVSSPVEPPTNEQTPSTNQLPAVVPSPYNIETPDLAPSTQQYTGGAADPNLVRNNIQNQLSDSGKQRLQPESATTYTDVEAESGSVENNNAPNDSNASSSPQDNAAMTSGNGVKVNYALSGKERSGMPDPKIIDLVKRAAETVGMSSITVTSGKGDYISESGKRRGQKTTMHSTGLAVDVVGFKDFQQKLDFARAARSMGAGGVGVYANESLHVDLGPKRQWNWGGQPFPLAEGGKVHAKEGGTLTLLAEAGEPEYVVPQSKVENFAHEMLAARPSSRNKTKKHTHLMIVPIYT